MVIKFTRLLKIKQFLGVVSASGAILMAIFLASYQPQSEAYAEKVIAVVRNQPHYAKVEGCAGVNTGVLEINVVATADGAMAGVRDCLKVTTNSPDGYRFYLSLAGEKQEGMLIKRSAGGTELVGDASQYSENERIAGVNGTIQVPKVLDNNTWGFALKTKETSLIATGFDENYGGSGVNFTPSRTSKWARVPKQGETLAAHETNTRNDTPNAVLITPTNPEGKGAELNLYYGVRVNNSLKDGTYVGKIVYTVVAKTVGSVNDLGSATYLQDATPAMCALSPEGQEYNLIDRRDGKSYRVAKLKDGNCWMTQSLAFQLDSDAGVDLALSDINLKAEIQNPVQDDKYQKRFYPEVSTRQINGEYSGSYDYQNYNSVIEAGNDSGVYYEANAALVNKEFYYPDSGNWYKYRGTVCPKNWTLPQASSAEYKAYRNSHRRYVNNISFDSLAFYNYSAEMKKRKDAVGLEYGTSEVWDDRVFDIGRLLDNQNEDKLLAAPNAFQKNGNLKYGVNKMSVDGKNEYGLYWQVGLISENIGEYPTNKYLLKHSMEIFGIGNWDPKRLHLGRKNDRKSGRRIWKNILSNLLPDYFYGVQDENNRPSAQVRCVMFRGGNLLHRLGDIIEEPT